MLHVIRNLTLFKLGWLACVLFAAAGKPLLATLAVAVVAAVHLFSVPVAVKEALLLMAAALLGLAWESTLVITGVLLYPGYEGSGLWAPYWIVAMWVLFATTINHGLKWVKKRWSYAVIAGLIGGPLAFYGGASMGAVEFQNTWTALAVIGAGWAVLLPLLVLISDTIIDSPWLEPGGAPAASRVSDRRLAGRALMPLPIYERGLRNDR